MQLALAGASTSTPFGSVKTEKKGFFHNRGIGRGEVKPRLNLIITLLKSS